MRHDHVIRVSSFERRIQWIFQDGHVVVASTDDCGPPVGLSLFAKHIAEADAPKRLPSDGKRFLRGAARSFCFAMPL